MKVKKKYHPLFRACSSVLGNLSAGWFGLAILTPNFINLEMIEAVFVLTMDVLLGILFLCLTTLVEGFIDK